MGNLYPDRFGAQQLNWITDEQIVFSLPAELLARLDEARGDLSRGDAVEAVISSLLKGTAEINAVGGAAAATEAPEAPGNLEDVDFSQDYFELLENADEHGSPAADSVVARDDTRTGSRSGGDGSDATAGLRRTVRRQRWLMAACVVIALGGYGYSALLGQKVEDAGTRSAQLSASRAQLQRDLDEARAESNDLILKLAHVERSLERARAEIELSLNRAPTVEGLIETDPDSLSSPTASDSLPPLSMSVEGGTGNGAGPADLMPGLPDFGPVRTDQDGDALPVGDVQDATASERPAPESPVAGTPSPKDNPMVASVAPARLPPPPPRKPAPPPQVEAPRLPNFGPTANAPGNAPGNLSGRVPATIPEAARQAFPSSTSLSMPPGSLTIPPGLGNPGASTAAGGIPPTPRFGGSGPAAQAGRVLPQRVPQNVPRTSVAPVPAPGTSTNFATGGALPQPGRKSTLAVGGALSN